MHPFFWRELDEIVMAGGTSEHPDRAGELQLIPESIAQKPQSLWREMRPVIATPALDDAAQVLIAKSAEGPFDRFAVSIRNMIAKAHASVYVHVLFFCNNTWNGGFP